MADNIFTQQKEKLGLSYSNLGEKVGVSKAYAHKMLEEPGRVTNLPLLKSLGKILNMSEADVESAWLEATKKYQIKRAEKRVGSNGSKKRGKVKWKI